MGKSRRAYHEGSDSYFVKDPGTLWFCGYRGQRNLIIDEFRGGIDISHLLLWADRYAFSVQVKGGSVASEWDTITICSNLPPRHWYPLVDDDTYAALERRYEIIEFTEPWEPIESEELVEIEE